MGLAGAITLITQLIKLAPPAFTTNFPKTIAWVVTAIVVGGLGYYQKADPASVATIGIAVGFASNGLYDVLADLWNKIKN